MIVAVDDGKKIIVIKFPVSWFQWKLCEIRDTAFQQKAVAVIGIFHHFHDVGADRSERLSGMLFHVGQDVFFRYIAV